MPEIPDVILTEERRQELLKNLMEYEGYPSMEAMLEDNVTDSVTMAICANCEAVHEMEPDQRAGYCDGCGKNEVVAILVLAGVI